MKKYKFIYRDNDFEFIAFDGVEMEIEDLFVTFYSIQHGKIRIHFGDFDECERFCISTKNALKRKDLVTFGMEASDDTLLVHCMYHCYWFNNTYKIQKQDIELKTGGNNVCTECNHCICPTNCPNYEPRTAHILCDHCDDYIFDGDDYYELEGLTLCQDCGRTVFEEECGRTFIAEEDFKDCCDDWED